MYTPAQFAITDTASMHEIMRTNSFATIVTDAGGLVASHLPFMVAEGGERGLGVLRAHMARANGQWRAFDGEVEALVIFQGTHGYISPSWYGPGPAVPTWDYVAAHAYGRPRIVGDEAAVLSMLGDLVDQNEAGRAGRWSMSSEDGEYLRKLSHGVVAFEIAIERLEGKAKLGQTRSADQPRVVEELRGLGADALAAAIATANPA